MSRRSSHSPLFYTFIVLILTLLVSYFGVINAESKKPHQIPSGTYTCADCIRNPNFPLCKIMKCDPVTPKNEKQKATLILDNQSDFPLRFIAFAGSPEQETRVTPKAISLNAHQRQIFRKILPIGRNRFEIINGVMITRKVNPQSFLDSGSEVTVPYYGVFTPRQETFYVNNNGPQTVNKEYIITITNQKLKLIDYAYASLNIENNLDVPISISRIMDEKFTKEKNYGKVTARELAGDIKKTVLWGMVQPPPPNQYTYLGRMNQRVSARVTTTLHPGRNMFRIQILKDVSPFQKRLVVEKSVWVDNKGIETFKKTYNLIITEKDFTQ